jgi:hypothetical protein
MVMFDCARKVPGCNPEQSYEDIKARGFNGCGTFISYPYFTLVVVSLGWVALNLVIGVVIEGFIEASAEEKLESVRTQYGELMHRWSEEANDPEQHVIGLETLVSILETIDQPVGYKDCFPGEIKIRYRRIRMHLASTELHVYHANDVHIRDVAINVCVRLIEKERPDLAMAQKDPEQLLSKSLLQKFSRRFPKYHRRHEYGVAHLLASNALNKLLRGVNERMSIKEQEHKRLVAEGHPAATSPNAQMSAEDVLTRMTSSASRGMRVEKGAHEEI